MIGDRYATDVAFGNRLGMLTIRPKPFTLSGEPLAVRAVSTSGIGRAASSDLSPALVCVNSKQVLLEWQKLIL